MNYRFVSWLLCALLNLLAVLGNVYAAVVTGSWVNVLFIVINSFALAWCIYNVLDSLDWKE